MEDRQDIHRPEYSPAPAKPPGFDERLAFIGGRTLGGQPKFRVVWGGDARGFPSPDPEELKYPSPFDPLVGWNCWILEEHAGPEFFGDPADWERNRYTTDGVGNRVAVTADYPSRGEYVFVQPLTTPSGEMFPLGEQALDYVRFLVRGAHQRPHSEMTQQREIVDRLTKLREWKEERRAEVSRRQVEEIYERTKQTEGETNVGMTREWSKPLASTLKNSLKRVTRGKQHKGATTQ